MLHMSLGVSKYRGVDQADSEHGASLTSTFISPVHSPDDSRVSTNSESTERTRKESLGPYWLPSILFASAIIILLTALVVQVSISNSLQRDNDESYYEPTGFQLESMVSVNSPSDTSAQTTAPFQLYKNRYNTNQMFMLINSTFVVQSIPFLFIEQLVQGVGDRKLFWDAGNIIAQDLVRFRRIGNDRIALQALPTHYRSQSDLIDRSFAISTIWSNPILFATGTGYWVNITELGLYPAGLIHSNDLATVIANTYGSQYQYEVNPTLSFIDAARSRSNSLRSYWTSNVTYELSSLSAPPHLEEILATGKYISISIRRTLLVLDRWVNDGRANTSTSRHAFNYMPRLFHPKSGFNYISYMNEDASLLGVRNQQYIVRHQMQDQEGNVRPLVYYIDSITPQPILNALLEGVAWWDEAFQYAGYPKGSFIVKIAPADFDPYDFYDPPIHYVEWIDRDLRYYSVGLRVIDPRTGLILKGHVRLEGLRIRQDALLLSSLLSPYTLPDGSIDPSLEKAMNDAILQRVKHLGAHEVGHTLGLSHNFAGSTYTLGPASVMDYPPPLVQINAENGQLLVGNTSYTNQIGFFDKVSIAYGYKDLGIQPLTASSQEWTALNALLGEAEEQGYAYLTDLDSGIEASDWRGTKWDYGLQPLMALNASMAVRRTALSALSEQAVVGQSALSRLLETLPLVYLWHRYQIEAASKLIGGREVSYIMRGDGSKQMISRPISGVLQRQAILQLLAVVTAEELSLSEEVLSLCTSASFGFEPEVGGFEDLFSSRHGNYDVDPVVMVETVAAMVFTNALDRHRLERVFLQAQYNATLPPLAEVLQSFTDGVFPDAASLSWQTQHVQSVYLHVILTLQAQTSKVSAVVDEEIQRAIDYIQALLDSAIMNCEGKDSVYDLSSTCNHYRRLLVAIAGRKPFLNLLPTPEGPPI